MSKLLTPIILLILLMSLYSTAASAHDIEVKNADGVTIYYNWINNNTEVAVGYRGENLVSYNNEYSGNVVIPESVIYNGNNYKVTSIGNDTFRGCYGLTSVTISNSVTSIGNEAFSGCSDLSSITIPNSVTSIGKEAFFNCSGLTSITIPNSVTSIGTRAFSGCIGLTSIVVESGNSVYDSRDNCNAIIETQRNELSVGCKETIIPNSVTSIGEFAFLGYSSLTSISIPNSVTFIGNFAFWICSGLTYITIPNCVTSIGKEAFRGCGLTSVIIPNSVTSIGDGAFYGCSGLTSVISKIQKPFEIVSCFENSIYSNATLIIPKGTKAAYQATEGWKKFVNIVEEGATDETLFTIDGTTYQGSGSNKTAQVKSVDTKLKYLVISASVSYNGTSYQVTGAADNAFSGSTMAALIWNADAALPSNAFNNASIGSNFLLYVKSESYAPSSVRNVVVNGTAQAIVLSDDGGQFYCPQSFTARSISYTHNYSMETGGNGKGWETIALPFNVQRISHTTRGELIPFASYNGGANQKPFWLASMMSGGFRNSSKIEANTPYIIAMPNSNKYQNEFNLAGDVTFSAENVSVPATPTFSGTFVPTYSTVTKSSNVLALNVVNKYVSSSGGYDAGSRFISNLRDVRPFESYISQGSSTRGVIEIGFGDGTTGMGEVMGVYDADRPIDIYTLSGQKVAQGKQSEIENILNQLPHGVYIVNGKKIVK